jgi:hypothetical protein
MSATRFVEANRPPLASRRPLRPFRHRPAAQITAFAVALAGALAVALAQGPKHFYYDSGGYWALGETFFSHGHFSLTNFDSPLRGYMLPLIDHGLHRLAVGVGWRGSTSVKLFNASLFALIGAVLVPLLATAIWPAQRWNAPRRLLVVALLLVFWSGYLDYPLSDFPALAMALVAILAATRPFAARWTLLAGVATAAAIDMRPSYLLLAPIVFGLEAWRWLERRRDPGCSATRAALCLGLGFAGFAVVSLPQSLSAHRHFGTYSFIPGSPRNLEATQLTEGMALQLYDTFVGPGSRPQMDYVDESGARLLSEQPKREVKGMGQYLGLVVAHPLTFAGLFARHAINGLDVRYSTPYVGRLRENWWLRIGGFLLVLLAALRVLWPTARRNLGTASWRYFGALPICCATALPAAVETRYLLPAFALSYMVVLAPGWRSTIAAARTSANRHLLVGATVSACFLFTLVVWHVTSGATHSLRFAAWQAR